MYISVLFIVVALRSPLRSTLRYTSASGARANSFGKSPTMPITQTRMTALISAAEHFQSLYHSLKLHLKEVLEQSAHLPALERLDLVFFAIQESSPEYIHITTLAEEKAHFRATWKSNAQRASRLRRARHAAAGAYGPEGNFDPLYEAPAAGTGGPAPQLGIGNSPLSLRSIGKREPAAGEPAAGEGVPQEAEGPQADESAQADESFPFRNDTGG